MKAVSRFSGALFAIAAVLGPFNPAALADPQAISSDKPTKRDNWPCPGCVAILPPIKSAELKPPMLVLIHGDEGSVRVVLQVWQKPLEKRGIILLALRCPKALGCAGSYWQWAGEFDWIAEQTEAVLAEYPADRDRVYLSGWSGGSTYIGMMEPKLPEIFAAININGGGAPPGISSCAPRKVPVYYFMGGKNPLIELAERARDHFRSCGHPLEWDFHSELNHAGELRVLSSEAQTTRILDWLLAQKRMNAENNVPPAPPPSEMPSHSVELPKTPPAVNSSGMIPKSVVKPPPSGRGCGCGVPAQSDAMDRASIIIAVLVLGFAGVFIRRRRFHFAASKTRHIVGPQPGAFGEIAAAPAAFGFHASREL